MWVQRDRSRRKRRIAALILLLSHAVAVPLCFKLGMAAWGCDGGSNLCRVGAICYLVVGCLLNLGYDRWMNRPRRYTLVTIPVFLVGASLVLAYPCRNMRRLDEVRQAQSLRAVLKLGEALEEGLRLEPTRRITSVEELERWSEKSLPKVDGWGRPLVVSVDKGEYYVVSRGACGEPDVEDFKDYTPGETRSCRDDIVFSDGRFLRRPASERH
jgi:hypothetical protein